MHATRFVRSIFRLLIFLLILSGRSVRCHFWVRRTQDTPHSSAPCEAKMDQDVVSTPLKRLSRSPSPPRKKQRRFAENIQKRLKAKSKEAWDLKRKALDNVLFKCEIFPDLAVLDIDQWPKYNDLTPVQIAHAVFKVYSERLELILQLGQLPSFSGIGTLDLQDFIQFEVSTKRKWIKSPRAALVFLLVHYIYLTCHRRDKS